MSIYSRRLLEGATRATEPKSRTFHTLDGLRGLAALAVVIWHLPKSDQTGHLLPSAYMAVDLFFMLSGFVLAYRYGNKLGETRDAVRFLIMRLIRLYPLYLLGTLIGAAWALHNLLLHGESLASWPAKLGVGLMMLPIPFGHRPTFPFNPPAWSLFYELVVNIVFGFTARWVKGTALLVVIGIAVVALTVATLHFGHMRFTSRMPLFLLGSVRAVFGFYVGVLLHRLREEGRLPLPRLHPALILVAMVLCLIVPNSLGLLTPVLLLLVSFIAFPLIIMAGLANEPAGWLSKAMQTLGLLSFPLYAIHFPILRIVAALAVHVNAPLLATQVVSILVSLGAAWVAAKVFDAPVRKWLTGLAKRKLPA